MTDSADTPVNVICIATYFKGGDFIRECKQHGCHVTLITKEKMLKEDWPRDSLDEVFALPNTAEPALFIDLVSFLSRESKPDCIVALEEFDVITAALVREHFRMPGLSSSRAKTFRDKMAMALAAQQAGLDVPDFVPLINRPEISAFMDRVEPPWILKPRSDVSAIGIRKIDQPAEVWKTVDEMNEREALRERSSYYLLARFVAGEVFHVDSIVNKGRVAFAGANKYGRPPMDVAHKGGAYISRTIPHGSEDERKLFEANRKLVRALGLERGATHAEFIKSELDGKFYFLEIAARVGGAYIAEVLEAASGINLWREWAKIEVGEALKQKTGRKDTPATRTKPSRREYAGIVLSLAKQEAPDTSSYDDPEIVYRVKKRHHAGLIVRSPKHARVEELLGEYATRFANDFAAVLPPLEKAE